MLIPGRHILGEGVLIELQGLIVNILEPLPSLGFNGGSTITVKAEVRML
jgi:hypothetical protein